MDDRATIRVPIDLKSKLDGLKEEYRASSIPAAIDRLMQEQKMLQERIQRMRESQDANMIDIGDKRKEELTGMRNELGLRSDADALDFLLAHYRHSTEFSKATLIQYGRMLKA